MSARHPPRAAVTATDLAVHAAVLEGRLVRARQDLAASQALNRVLVQVLVRWASPMRPAAPPVPSRAEEDHPHAR